MGKELGRGAFSIVREATSKETGERVAVKEIEKKHVDKDGLKLLSREIDIMKKVNHDNVLALLSVYETDTTLSLVTEFINGGELFYIVVDRGYFYEDDARNVIRQICLGVKYLHEVGIAHRDLKPENILCQTSKELKEEMIIKIADFGLSKVFGDGNELSTSCGTPDYAAPEVLRMEGTYDKAVDMWSVGVISYVLLCGFPPFYAKTQAVLFERIMNAEYTFPEPEWSQVSDSAKDFVTSLLQVDSKRRFTPQQCLEHPWLSAVRKVSSRADSQAGGNTITLLRDYNKKRKAQTGG